MSRIIVLYGIGLALLALFLSSVKYFYFVRQLPAEGMVLLLAILFTGVGIWAGRRWVGTGPSRSESDLINQRAIETLGLTRREVDVLHLMAEGCSNQEIAERLFVTVNTVKSHVSNLLGKLSVQRRTQAVHKAHALGLIGSPERGM
ncbi:MAG: response regulator transcription factor [Pseudomonadota bacterium]